MTRSSLQPMNSCFYSDNWIDNKEAYALAEYLKQNTTLTELNLEGMSNLDRLLSVVVWQDPADN